jgi:hypothetical protein
METHHDSRWPRLFGEHSREFATNIMHYKKYARDEGREMLTQLQVSRWLVGI